MSVLDGLDLSYSLEISDEEIDGARSRKAEHVYEMFLSPVFDDFSGREIFQPSQLQGEIRPPYSYSEVKDALEYGASEKEGLEVLEEDMDLFLYDGS